MAKSTPPLVRIVVPCFNEETGIRVFFTELAAVLARLPDFEFEIAFVDDGSTDRTLAELNRISATVPFVRVYSLSRNFGHQAALLAGIDTSSETTDALLMMDSDLQHPPSCIPEMLAAWQSGCDVVSMVRRRQKSLPVVKRLMSWLYYRVFREMSDVAIVAGAADFCLLGKSALTAIRSMPERDLFLRGAIAWIGFSRKLLEFDVPSRFAGTSKYSVSKMLRLARLGIFSFSTSPIRLTFRMGLTLTGLASLHLVYSLVQYANGGTVRGWTSMIAVVVFFGGLNLFTLGVLGEYIARTFEEVKQRPRYLFKQVPTARTLTEVEVESRDWFLNKPNQFTDRLV